MTKFFWMKSGVAEDCGYEAKLEKSLYHSDKYIKTNNYLKGHSNGELDTWEMYLHKPPCDFVSTPFTPIVSEKFKKMTQAAGIPVTYHNIINIFVDGQSTDLKYFFAVPERYDFVDQSTAKVTPDDHPDYPGWFSCNQFSTKVSYESLAGLDWVASNKAFGTAWVVSEKFANIIKEHKIDPPRFWLAKNSD